LLKKKFTWIEVDDPNRQIYNRESITLLKLEKIPERDPTQRKKRQV